MTYQQFYLTTEKGEEDLRNRLKNNPQEVIDAKKRLAELEFLLGPDDKRCHVSKVQRDFLKRVLAEY